MSGRQKRPRSKPLTNSADCETPRRSPGPAAVGCSFPTLYTAFSNSRWAYRRYMGSLNSICHRSAQICQPGLIKFARQESTCAKQKVRGRFPSCNTKQSADHSSALPKLVAHSFLRLPRTNFHDFAGKIPLDKRRNHTTRTSDFTL